MMTHNELAHDLAKWLSNPRGMSAGFLTWENIEIPPDPENIGAGGRPDIYAIGATLSEQKWNPVAYEVKISVADFEADTRSGKWKKYLPYSAYVVFAVPEHIAAKIETPDGCGLIVRLENGDWVRKKRGRRNTGWKLTDKQWMNLCLKGRNPSPWEIRIERANRRESA